MPEKTHKELKSTTAGLIFSTALFFDALQAAAQIVPFLGQVLASLVAIFAFMTFWLWFRTYGIKFSTPKRSAIMGGGFIIELIPILNALPAWTLAVSLIIADQRIKKVAKDVGAVVPGKTGGSVDNDKAI